MPKVVLGLDLGPNSIGWALVNDDPERPAESKLIDLGVRVFPEGVDNFDTSKELSRNENRRIARGMRRQIRRRARRRQRLKDALISAGLWPADPTQEVDLYLADPYVLRARALKERLEPFEIGRVLLHLNQRRGFLSNRKKDRGDKEVQGMLAEINENEQNRKEGGFDTIGAWLADKQINIDHKDRREDDHVRNRHLARQQYDDEFEAIWGIQAKHHPKLLTEKLKYGTLGKQKYPIKPVPRWDDRRKGLSALESFGIYGLIFFQRPMYRPKSVVGQCELLPKRKRCPKADRRAQRFRLLQEVNNIKVIDDDQKIERKLTDDERTLLLEKLSQKEEMKFEAIIKELQKVPSFPSSEHVRLNLQAGKRTKMQGAPVDVMIAKVLGKSWYKRPENEKSSIVSLLLEYQHDDDECIRRLQRDWKLSIKETEELVALSLPQGYVNLSLEAIEQLLPHMNRGLLYMTDDNTPSALAAAGFERPDQLRRWVFGKLPNEFQWRDSPLGDIPNPIVRRTLVELRKVVNAIIAAYGRPAAVHVEMARDMSPRPKPGTEAFRKYQDRIKRMRELEEAHDIAEKWLRESGKTPNRENRIRYLLWKEQGEVCVYSGKPISPQQLFGGEVDIDHIWPRSKTLDDSQMNKVVCFRKTTSGLGNHDKGQRTPYEWLANERPDLYDQVCQRARKLPYRKYCRFLTRELELKDFVARQLNDTRYIAKAAAEYLRCLFDFDERKSGAVLGLKGQLTAELRWQWGLEKILEELPDSPAWRENHPELRPGEKNRADHRHHAIDALVVALTNRRRLHQLSGIVKRGGARAHGEVLDDPWPNFREDVVHRIKSVHVSHRVERKVAGALHADSHYWPTQSTGEYVKRKPIIDLSAAEIDEIRDDAIRQLVVETLMKSGIELRYGEKLTRESQAVMKNALSNIKMKSGVPVRRVRLRIRDKTIHPIRRNSSGAAYVKPDSTHHLCIFKWNENSTIKRDAVFVTMLRAIDCLKLQSRELTQLAKTWKKAGLKSHDIDQRKRRAMREIAAKYPVIQRDANKLEESDAERIPKHAQFVMSLSNGELVLLEIDGRQRLAKMRTSKSTENKIKFSLVEDARKAYRPINVNVNTLFTKYQARKVTVDSLGRIRWAND